MYQFQPGDLVRIRDQADLIQEYGISHGPLGEEICTPGVTILPGMQDYCGNICTVQSIEGDSVILDIPFYWPSCALEHIDAKPEDSQDWLHIMNFE